MIAPRQRAVGSRASAPSAFIARTAAASSAQTAQKTKTLCLIHILHLCHGGSSNAPPSIRDASSPRRGLLHRRRRISTPPSSNYLAYTHNSQRPSASNPLSSLPEKEPTPHNLNAGMLPRMSYLPPPLPRMRYLPPPPPLPPRESLPPPPRIKLPPMPPR